MNKDEQNEKGHGKRTLLPKKTGSTSPPLYLTMSPEYFDGEGLCSNKTNHEFDAILLVGDYDAEKDYISFKGNTMWKSSINPIKPEHDLRLRLTFSLTLGMNKYGLAISNNVMETIVYPDLLQHVLAVKEDIHRGIAPEGVHPFTDQITTIRIRWKKTPIKNDVVLDTIEFDIDKDTWNLITGHLETRLEVIKSTKKRRFNV